jgi:hypothetical protein
LKEEKLPDAVYTKSGQDQTSSLGVLLLSAHMGGAIATHMEHGEIFIPQAVMLLVVWIANYLRNPEMLSSFTK